MVKSISGCLTVGKSIYVALFYILHYIHLSVTCFSPKYCCVESKAEAMSLSQALSIHLSTSAFIGLGPVHVPDQTPVNWFEPILPPTLDKELDHKWL